MAEIILSDGQKAIVDNEDFERISKFKWTSKLGHKGSVRNIWYARRGTRRGGIQKSYRMHREIMGVTDPKIEIDHIDGNGLNNQKSNLRICTSSENGMNSIKRNKSTSRFKGVYFHKNRNKWASQAHINNQRLFIGYYDNEKEAALAYNVTASFAFGRFANLNQI